MKVKKEMLGDEEVYTLSSEKVPDEMRAGIDAAMNKITREVGKRVTDLQNVCEQAMPGLSNVVVLLCSPDGHTATVISTVDARRQIKALETALKLTQHVKKATDN